MLQLGRLWVEIVATIVQLVAIELHTCEIMGVHWGFGCVQMLSLEHFLHAFEIVLVCVPSCVSFVCFELTLCASWTNCALWVFQCFQLPSSKFLQALCLNASMAPKKRVKTTAASTSRAPAARGNSSLPHVINKYHLVLVDAEHASRYDSIVTRKISTPSYLDR